MLALVVEERLNFILVHHFLEEVGSLTDARLAQAFAFHFLADPVEVVDDASVDAWQRFSGATCDGEWSLMDFCVDELFPIYLPLPHETMPRISMEPVEPSVTIGPPESP